MSTESMITTQERNNAFLVIALEVLFVLVPFFITGIVLIYQGNLLKLLSKEEWSFAASILTGQALLKLILGLFKVGRIGEVEGPTISIAIVGIAIFILTPSLVVLVLILISNTPSLGLVIAQIILFLLGLIVFVIIGGLGDMLKIAGEKTRIVR